MRRNMHVSPFSIPKCSKADWKTWRAQDIVQESSQKTVRTNIYSGFSFVELSVIFILSHIFKIKSEYVSFWASLVAQMVKRLSAMQETQIWSLGWEDPLQKGMATHTNISCLENSMDRGVWWATVHGVESKTTLWASQVALMVKNAPAVQETWVWSLGWEDPLQMGMAIHSSISSL